MARRKWTKEEIEAYRKEKGIFYFNMEDSNIFVPKAYGFGMTFNWGNPVAWVFIAVIVGFIVFRLFLRVR